MSSWLVLALACGREQPLGEPATPPEPSDLGVLRSSAAARDASRAAGLPTAHATSAAETQDASEDASDAPSPLSDNGTEGTSTVPHAAAPVDGAPGPADPARSAKSGAAAPASP